MPIVPFAGGSASLPFTNTVVVANTGVDSNDGLSEGSAVLTLARANEIAVELLNPFPPDPPPDFVTIYCPDASVFNENIVQTEVNVNVDLPRAKVIGDITAFNGSPQLNPAVFNIFEHDGTFNFNESCRFYCKIKNGNCNMTNNNLEPFLYVDNWQTGDYNIDEDNATGLIFFRVYSSNPGSISEPLGAITFGSTSDRRLPSES